MLTPTRVLLIVAFLDFLATGLVISQLAPNARKLGCSHLTFGVMGSLYSGFQLISEPITGSLSDIKGRKPVLSLILVVCGVSYTLLGLTSSVGIFLLLRCVQGCFKHTQLLIKALAPDYEKKTEDQSVVYGRLASIAGVGMVVGPATAGHIAEMFPNYGFTLICTVVGLTFAVNAGLISTLPVEKSKTKKEQTAVASNIFDNVSTSIQQSVAEIYKMEWEKYWEFFVFKLLITLCMGTFFNNFAIFLVTKHNVSPSNLGYVISFLGVFGSLSTFFIKFINQLYENDKDGTKRCFHVFLGLTSAFVGLNLAPNMYVYMLCIVPLAVTSSVARVVGMEIIVSKSDSSQRGTVIGASNSIRSLSGVLTPLLTGAVAEYIGPLYVIYLSIIFSATGLAVTYRLRQRSLAKDKHD